MSVVENAHFKQVEQIFDFIFNQKDSVEGESPVVLQQKAR